MNSLILITDIVEKLILTLLIGLSIWSVAIMINRRKLFKNKFINNDAEWEQKIRTQKKLEVSENQTDFISLAIKEFAQSNDPEKMDRLLSSYIRRERQIYEKGLTTLATLGANSPFIGLFGTVLGIIRSFAYLGSQSGSSQVMSGVSQALYATAVGLIVAIPAVVAFNNFNATIKIYIQKVESLKDLWIGLNKENAK